MWMSYPISEATKSFIAAPRKLLIGGVWRESATGEVLGIENPADETIFAHAANGNSEDVDRAARAAQAAFESRAWRRMSPAERTRLLLKVADLIEVHSEELVELDVLCMGKPANSAKAFDAAIAADMFRYNAGWSTKIGGKTSTPLLPDMRPAGAFGPPYHSYSVREPIGVVGIITPWNAPLVMFAGKVAPALAAGCTVIVKPAEEAPLSALRVGELFEEAGIPPGVLNIVTGRGEVAGAALVEHPIVRKITFVGSTMVGREIIAKTSGTLKRVTLELGGKSPVIICKDADLERAIPAAAAAVTINCGQNCFTGSRLYADRDIFDEVIDGIAAITDKLKIGAGFDEGVQLGPLISAAQLERVEGFFSDSALKGAQVVTGGARVGRKGHFFKPSIVVGSDQSARIFQEEVFGPVLAATPFDTPEQAVSLANGTQYGLAASLFCNDLSLTHRICGEIQSGAVWVNAYPAPDLNLPFGGFKQSGIGRENGEYGVESYTEMKSVTIAL